MRCILCFILSLSSLGAARALAEEHNQRQLTPEPQAQGMSVPASAGSLASFLGAYTFKPFLTFPESRENPIRMFDALPEVWTRKTPEDLTRFTADVRPGEYFVFQIGVYAHRDSVADLRVNWTALRGKPGISADNMTCLNTSGIDFQGRSFTHALSIPARRVQPLWFGVQIPSTARGTYTTRITLTASRVEAALVNVILNAAGAPIRNNGFDRGKSLSRLAWLNTTLGSDSKPSKGFPPISREGNVISVFGRSLELGADGLPAHIKSYFEPSNQFLVTEGMELLHAPFQFTVETEENGILHLQPGPLRFTHQTPGALEWEVVHTSASCDLRCSGRMEFDGFVGYELTLKAKRPLQIRDIRLEIPMRKEKSRYMMGLNHEGGLRPHQWSWMWDTTKNQDMLWVGDVNGGLRIKWMAENYRRPLINIYYAYGPLRLPPSWGNRGKGGVDVHEVGDQVRISAYSGARAIKPGEVLHYDCELLVTPFKIVDPVIKYHDRYFHGGGTNTMKKLDLAEEAGANIINIHHAEDIYPFINYPYLDENVPAFKALVAAAHQRNMRLKVYYTTRELTKNLPEFWALFSLNGEIIYPGPGNSCKTIINPNGPDEWLKTNLKEHYIPAWLNVIKEGPFKGELDLSVITTPDSRLNNFYIGGLNWMLENVGIDGVYIDDSALDRLTVRRARKLIDRYRPQGRIDFHSWNHFNDLAGYASCLNLYMDLLPYFDLVWIGEGRNYDRMPDHWLIEVSGIPFGLPGQMLAGGGNPWRGMVYGITNRAGWMGNPEEIWKFWDAYHIDTKRMIGYWDSVTPVRCTDDSLRATLYKGDNESIIAVANWGVEEKDCTINVDWKRLEYDPSQCSIKIPRIPDFQNEQQTASLTHLSVPGKKGYLLVLRNNAKKKE